MSSIYQRVMGAEFGKLHPKIQERFGFGSGDGVACIGRGVMETIWHGPCYTLPFLYIGTWRRILFPEQGKNVPFTVENYAYVDRFGRETVTWVRRFATVRPRRFDAYMVQSERSRCVVDYLGTHQHLAVDIHLSADPNGGLRLRSANDRCFEGPLGLHLPRLCTGTADVCEWYDDTCGQYRIEVNVTNAVWGPIFGYRGRFDAEWRRIAPADIPADVRPRREESRE
jgi:hypothetical protein